MSFCFVDESVRWSGISGISGISGLGYSDSDKSSIENDMYVRCAKKE